MNTVSVGAEIPKNIEGLSEIERGMLNALIAGINSLNSSLCYEILLNDDEPTVEFRDIGINIYDSNTLVAEVYCAQVVSGVTGEYQVTTFEQNRKRTRKIMLLSDASHKISNSAN